VGVVATEPLMRELTTQTPDVFEKLIIKIEGLEISVGAKVWSVMYPPP